MEKKCFSLSLCSDVLEMDMNVSVLYVTVYEETAGLMVNDPVLRTHKVILLSCHGFIFLDVYCDCISS